MAFRGNVDGLNAFSMVSTSGLSLTVINDGPCQLMQGVLGNVNAAARFLKLYDVSAAQALAQTSGLFTAIPVQNYIIPGNAAGAGSNFGQGGQVPAVGLQFFNGMAMQLTGNAALADASGVGGADCVVNLWWR